MPAGCHSSFANVKMIVILLSVLGILIQNASANTSSCNTEDLRTCRADALTQMSRSSSDGVNQDSQCRDLRDNFDCMLWQTAMCYKKEDQDEKTPVIWKTWRYLQGFCEKYINYWKSSCFQRDDVKRCESLLPSKTNSVDGQSCSMFVNFRECVVSIAESSCSISDRSLLGSYFMEKGREMAWRCPKDNDRGSMSAASAQQVDRRYSEMYGDSPSFACSVAARDELATCRTKFQETESEAQRRDDSDMRNYKICCALLDLDDCVKDAIKKKCGESEPAGIAETFISGIRKSWEDTCKDISDQDSCSGGASGASGGNSVDPMNTLAIYFLLYFVYFVFVKKF